MNIFLLSLSFPNRIEILTLQIQQKKKKKKNSQNNLQILKPEIKIQILEETIARQIWVSVRSSLILSTYAEN